MLVRERMTAPVITITPDHRFHDALHTMQEKNLHHLPVVDQREHLIGIISTMDILAEFADGATDED